MVGCYKETKKSDENGPGGMNPSPTNCWKRKPFARAKPARKASPSGEVAAKQAGRVQPIDGQHSKAAGRAYPAPTDCREPLCTRGAREGGCPKTGGDAQPVGTLQASQARPAPLKGEPFCAGIAREKASLVKGRCRAQARRRDSRPSARVTGNPARPVGIPQAANAASPL